MSLPYISVEDCFPVIRQTILDVPICLASCRSVPNLQLRLSSTAS